MEYLMLLCSCGNKTRIPASAMGTSVVCASCAQGVTATPLNTVPIPAAPPQAPPAPSSARPPATRLPMLDQLRGYAIFGMILVNYLGHFDVMPWAFRHHKTGFSYADTIAPLFVFVVGMGFRLSLLRRIQKTGLWAARWQTARRYLVLFVVALAFYGPDARIDWWDALTHIALAGLISLPFIDKNAGVRIGVAVGYLALFMLLYMGTSYGSSFMMRSMNGGPLGPLSWAFVLLFGTIAYDLLAAGDAKKALSWSFLAGIGLVLAGWVAWYLIPKDWAGYGEQYGAFWPLSKRWCIAPAMLLSTGLSFLTFALFYYICQVREFQFPTLTVLGQNALFIYLLQYALMEIHGAYIPDSSGVLPALLGFAGMYGFCYLAARKLYNEGIIIKL